MQTTSPPPASPPPPSDKFPDCVSMQLNAVPVRSEPSSSVSSDRQHVNQPEQVDLHLSIQFGEQEQPIPGGQVKFGIRGGELRLTLANCEMPLSEIELSGPFETNIPVKRVIKKARENQGGIEVALAEGKPGAKLNSNRKENNEVTEEFQTDIAQVTTKGSPHHPAWVFEERKGERVLRGLLKNAKLGRLNVIATPSHIDAIFKISLKDVIVTGMEGSWMVDILPEERTTIDRGIAKLLLNRQLKLSQPVGCAICLIRICLSGESSTGSA